MRWENEEVEYLKDNYSRTRNEELAEHLDRTERSIQNKAQSLNLKTDYRAIIARDIRQSDSFEPDDIKFAEYVVGLTDGEGHFGNVEVREGTDKFSFTILLKNDIEILERVKEFFGVGSIYSSNGEDRYQVQDAKSLGSVIIPFFLDHQPRARKKSKQFKQFVSKFENYYNVELTDDPDLEGE